MLVRPASLAAALTLAVAAVLLPGARAQEDSLADRVARLESEVQAAEDMSALKKLQRMYGYYLDKGMWEDLSELFADDAVANYPAGVYIGTESIRKHLYMNVGGGDMGEIGLREGRIYNHMNIQPVVHLDPGGQTAKGRWRAFAMFGSFGGGATWAEGVYEMTYVKDAGVWKIKTLDYHAGFGAPYSTGWVAPERPRAAGGRRNLPHPADRERNMACEGFPAACAGPFHYPNPGTPEGARAWQAAPAVGAAASLQGRALRRRAAELAHRAALLEDEQQIENLQKTFGYYYDRRLWDEVAELFAANGTIEMDLRGVYEGKERIREFLSLLGPEGLGEGELNDHVQLQIVVNVAPDGRTAKSRSRELNMTGAYQSHGTWSEGIYENSYVKEDGVWKLRSLRYFPTFISDYDKGWGADAQPAPTASTTLPPDRPPTDVYEIYPRPHIPPYHYRNPVSGEEPRYPSGPGKPSARAIAAVLAPVEPPEERDAGRGAAANAEELIAGAERRVQRVKDYHEIENLENAYGYYLDKNLWTDLAQLFAEQGSMELAQRGVYVGRDRVRAFLFEVFGPEGPVEGRLGNHVKMQPVIQVAEDGASATIRSRMMQQLSFGNRASMGAAVYENGAVKENGIWKFSKVHAYNTWTAGYDGGWIRSSTGRVPGPSQSYPPDRPPTLVFPMYPAVYAVPFEQPHPVTGRRVVDKVRGS